MSFLLWLLLPVAAASGWLVAQHQKRRKPISSHLSPDYLKGLNYWLREEPDKAIDIFIKLIDVNNETFETHLALGVLFRRRGEVNQAIHIHQNIIKIPTLDPQKRNLALFELAHDYQNAGLFDRAEDVFKNLLIVENYQIPALSQLLKIYEQEQEWEKAIKVAQKLAKLSGKKMPIAQYYCEQAENYREQGNTNRVQQLIQKALDTDPFCVRASIIEASLALENNDYRQAIVAFKRVEKQDHKYIIEIIDDLHDCYHAIGQIDQFQVYLQAILNRYDEITPILSFVKIIQQQLGRQQAIDFVSKQMLERPSLCSINSFLALSKADNTLLHNTITQLLNNKAFYKCNNCGFTARKLYWHCPSCKKWNTMKSIQGIDGD
ncbi:lipopolysaccharide assembly protein LapB [Candidatus Marithrix sp. Canyon 246]|uniref:lipopolysaccharide assembly protein LapB n=1 Tax=Candidatus Marithrix sp. Canyon 246 TaxID=1827136 RepID=UPI00084A19D2|nr:lipopolysaccharide assembly protein LapB [Candidatus Marithrix sp. Canyon 246]